MSMWTTLMTPDNVAHGLLKIDRKRSVTTRLQQIFGDAPEKSPLVPWVIGVKSGSI